MDNTFAGAGKRYWPGYGRSGNRTWASMADRYAQWRYAGERKTKAKT